MPRQPADVAKLARLSLTGSRHIQYCLEPGRNGGRNPTAPDCSSSWERRGKLVFTADCVGFAAWCTGFDRYQPGFPLQGGWINTTAMVKAAEEGLGWFDELSPWERAEAGCLVVYPRRLPFRRWGHVGVYVGNNRVIHCHGPALRGPAISESDVREFTKKGALFVRFAPPRRVDSSS